MEKNDEILITKYIDQDEELRKYVEDHRRLENELENFNRRVYLTPEEAIRRKQMQKRKLRGRDRIQEILAKYRA